MAKRISQSNSSFLSNKGHKLYETTSNIGTVVFVYLDDTEFETITIPDDVSEDVSDKQSLLGYAKIVNRKDTSYDLADVNPYPPYNIEEGLPILGEVVELVQIGGNYHYKRIFNIDINKGNAEEDALLKGLPVESSETNSSDYSESSQTGTPAGGAGDDRKNKLGKYFEFTKINPLKFYEGDKIIQSRFGQSIRFSGYNNEDNVFSPTIIIRNRQNDKSLEDLKEFEITEENVVEDGSTIAITSGEYLLGFIPGTEDSPFDTEPVYYEAPEELKGTDQILVNSGRIILSSKDSEMIFFSKGNLSIISDGKFTLDNGNDGAFIDLNGEYRTTTNDNDIYFLAGNGKVFLNTEEEKEPIVRGQALVDILSEILTELSTETHPTPAGPSGPPINAAKYNAIKGKLDTILSTLNFTE